MAVNFCLIPSQVDKFMGALRSGKIDPAKLADMTSADRHKFFSGIVGEDNAKGVNALFESKLLLKYQTYGMVNWAKKVGGITPEVRRDMISRIQKLENVLDPADQKQFLYDLASTRLGVDVTAAEAKKIAEMSRKVESTRLAMASGGDRLAYGKAKIDLANYVGELKAHAVRTTPLDYLKHPGKAVTDLAGTSKAIKASMDNSAIFRQGWKTLFTNPKIWQKNARQSFVDLVRQFGGKEVMDEVHADILSRPNYERYRKAGLAISTVEEAYPSTLPERIPLLGRAYKASESAYTGFVYRQRADVFDKYMEIAKKAGVNIDDKAQLKAIGKLVNSLTGRGNLGAAERAAGTVNNIFFSPRMLKSQFDTLTAHQLQKGVTPFVRKQAAKNLVEVIAGTASILAIANAVKPGSVDIDPRSSDFGKIKIGNTRFDVSGGMSSVLTLATRLISQSSKSGTTGIVSKLNSGYGSQTGIDVVNNFLENKLSPASSVIKDIIKQQDFNGNKPTVTGELTNLLVPLPATTYAELKGDPNSANDLVGLLADALGVNTNTYGKSNANWDKNTNKTIEGFRSAVGEGKLKTANTDFNKRYDEWVKLNPMRGASDIEKQHAILQAKGILQAQVFKDYGYAPKELKSKVNAKLPGFNIQQGQHTPQGLVNNVVTYAKAIGTSPTTAFERIFTGQRIIRTQNGAIIVQRLPLSSSQAIKAKGGGKNATMKLDHTVPLELGGSNDTGNLKLVTTKQWASYTPIEDYLGRKLKTGDIKAKDATRLIKAFKNGQMSAQDVYNWKK